MGEVNLIDNDKDYGSRFTLWVEINNNRIKGLLDGGTGPMIVGEEVAKDCNLKIHPFNGNLKSAFNQIVRIRGVCYLKYVFDGKERVVRALVARITSCPLFLGSDFFKENGLVLDHGLNKVWYRHSGEDVLIELCADRMAVSFNALEEQEWKSVTQSVNCGSAVGGVRRTHWAHHSRAGSQWPLQKEEQPIGGKVNAGSANNTRESDGTNNLIHTSEAEPNVCFVEVEEFEPTETQEICWAEAYPSKDKKEEVKRRIKFMLKKHFDRTDKWSLFDAFDFHDLPMSEQNILRDIIWEFKDVCSEDDFDIGICPAFVQPITTEEGFELKFRKHGVRKYKQEDKEFMEDWVAITKERGIVTNSNSHISCAAHVVKSGSKNKRMVLDYRPLNHFIKTEDYPYVSISEIFDSLAKSVYFTCIDLTMAFYAILISPEDQWKTSFTTHNELLQMTRLPMGLKLSPKAMQHLTDQLVFRRDHLLAYIDDIMCKSETFDEHVVHFRDMLSRLREFNLKMKPSKVQLFKKKIKFLGYLISADGIEIPPNYVKAVKDIPIPKDQKRIRQFMGMVNFTIKHLPGINELAEPLNNLLRKNVPYVWTEKHTENFNKIKNLLTTAPVLSFPDETLKKVLYTDASNYAIGGMLGQLKEGEVRIIAYFNKTLSRAERKWATIEKELWAVVYGCRKFRKYLDNPFEVYTDHKPLLCLNNFKDIQNARLNRWGIELSSLDFKTKHIKGVDNQIADALSRLIKCKEIERSDQSAIESIDSHQLAQALDRDADEDVLDTDSNADDGDLQEREDVMFSLLAIDTPEYEEEFTENLLQSEQNSDLFCQMIKSKLQMNGRQSKALKNRFIDINGVLHRKKRRNARNLQTLQIVIPSKLVDRVIKIFHRSAEEGGHRGRRKCEEDIANKYWFENMREHIRAHIRVCGVCNRVKPSNTRPYGIPHVYVVPTQPFEHIHMDVCGPFLRSKRGKLHILTIVDRITRYVYAKALVNHTKETIMSAMLKMFNKFIIPKRLTTDRAPEFMSEDFQEFLRGLGIEHHPTASYYAASNGLAELNNRKLVQIIRSYVNHRNKDWDSFVGIAAKIINKTVNSVTNYTPFYLLFGFDPCNAFERKFKLEVNKHSEEYENEDQDLSGDSILERARQEARARTEAAEEEWRKMAEKRLITPPFEPKSLVWAIDKTQEPGIPHKLRPLKCGPWIVIKEVVRGTYHIYPMVKMGGKQKRVRVVNARLLFPYFGRKPRGFNQMCLKIDKGDFTSEEPDVSEGVPWDVMYLNAWNRYLEESQRQVLSERNLRSHSSQNLSQLSHTLSQSVIQSNSQVSASHTQEDNGPITDFSSESSQRLENVYQNRPINESQTLREGIPAEWHQYFNTDDSSFREFSGFSANDRVSTESNPLTTTISQVSNQSFSETPIPRNADISESIEIPIILSQSTPVVQTDTPYISITPEARPQRVKRQPNWLADYAVKPTNL